MSERRRMETAVMPKATEWSQRPNRQHTISSFVLTPGSKLAWYGAATLFGVALLIETYALLVETKIAVVDWPYFVAMAFIFPMGMASLGGGIVGLIVVWSRLYWFEPALLETEIETPVEVNQNARIIPYTRGNIPQAPIVQDRPSKTLEGVIFRGSVLTKICEMMRSGKIKITRDGCGFTSTEFPTSREVLKRAGYIDANNDITPMGAVWFHEEHDPPI